MSAGELLKNAEFVVDSEGKKKAVILDYKIWEDLLSYLEDWEDAAEIQRLRGSEDDIISWEEAKKELRKEGIDV